MNIDSLRKYCATLPGATRDIKWGADEVYSVGAKMFAVFWIERGKARTASMVMAKLTRKEQAPITAQPAKRSANA